MSDDRVSKKGARSRGFLHQALGWSVVLVILAIIGTVTTAAQSAFGDTGAYVAFFGLVAMVGLGLAFYYDNSLGATLLSIPLALLAAAAAAVLAIAAVVITGYGFIQFFALYGILGAIFLVLVVIAIQLGYLSRRR